MEFTGICFNQNFQSDLKQHHHLSRTHTRQVLANEATNSGKCFNFLLYYIKAGMFYSEMFHLVWICYKQWYRQFLTCRGQNNSGYYRVVLEQDWAKNSSILCLCVCCVHTYCTCVCVYSLVVYKQECGINQLCRSQCVLCVCLRITALPTGNCWLCCFEVRLLSLMNREDEQVLEQADSSAQHVLFAFITLLHDQTIKKNIMTNKGQVKSNVCPCVSLRI